MKVLLKERRNERSGHCLSFSPIRQQNLRQGKRREHGRIKHDFFRHATECKSAARTHKLTANVFTVYHPKTKRITISKTCPKHEPTKGKSVFAHACCKLCYSFACSNSRQWNAKIIHTMKERFMRQHAGPTTSKPNQLSVWAF